MQNLQIVDHQIQHHIDIQTSRAEYRQAIHFDEASITTEIQETLNRWVVKLDVPYSQHSTDPTLEQLIRSFERWCQRFLDKRIDPALQQIAADRSMIHRWHRHDACIDLSGK
ncbi:MAG: hypothetical protein P8Y44_10135 [Acidobacteriota bacterium]